MTYKVFISLPDALKAMDDARKNDITATGIELPDAFDAKRAKNILNNLTKYEGLVKPVRCKLCRYPKQDQNLIYDCERNPGGYLGDDGYCSLGEIDPAKVIAKMANTDIYNI